MLLLSGISQLGLYILYVALPILALYVGVSLLKKAFRYLGFSSLEATIMIIVFLFFWLFKGIVLFGFNMSEIYLASYNNWILGISMGGAVIPIALSIYLTVKKKIPLKKVLITIVIVTIISFFVTYFKPGSGIASSFPYWLLPAATASFFSVLLLWGDFKKSAPLAYVSGTIGVLIGADFLHLPELLNYSTNSSTNAVIGGAEIFDLIFITGILAVILVGIIMFPQKRKSSSSNN